MPTKRLRWPLLGPPCTSYVSSSLVACYYSPVCCFLASSQLDHRQIPLQMLKKLFTMGFGIGIHTGTRVFSHHIQTLAGPLLPPPASPHLRNHPVGLMPPFTLPTPRRLSRLLIAPVFQTPMTPAKPRRCVLVHVR